jgi:hypothetical protein
MSLATPERSLYFKELRQMFPYFFWTWLFDCVSLSRQASSLIGKLLPMALR